MNDDDERTEKKRPAWEVYFVGSDGKVLERAWKNEKKGTEGTCWDRRGVLWQDRSKNGAAILSGTIKLPDGTEQRVRLYATRRTEK